MYVQTRSNLPGGKKNRRRSPSGSADILSVSQIDGKFGGVLRCQGCAAERGHCVIAFSRHSQDEVEEAAKQAMQGCEFDSGMYNVSAITVAESVAQVAAELS